MPVPALSFTTSQDGVERSVPVVARDDVVDDEAAALQERLGRVDWSRLQHAYGPRGELGDDAMDRQDELERWALAGWSE